MRSAGPWFALCIFVFASDAVGQQNWPQFRGTDAVGVTQRDDLPDRWSTIENILWTQDVPGRGWSSPIVWADRLFLTTVVNQGASEEPTKGLYFGGNRAKPPPTVHQWKLVCLQLDTGKILWERLAHEGVPESPKHIKNSFASETPVTDGQRVYAYFGNVGVYCYDMEGGEIWSHKWPASKIRHNWGTAASPVLHNNRLYIVNDNEDTSYLAALDAQTGEEIWRTERDEKSNWATPYIWRNPLRTEIITPGTGKCRSYDLDGNLLYEWGGMSSITIATPYAAHGLLYVSSGYVLDAKKPIFAIRPGASGDITLEEDQTSNDHVAWCQKMAGPYNPTTLVYGDLMYVLLDRGFFACYDARTGEEVYGRKRLPNGRAFTASPWASAGKIYCLNEYGETFVVKAGESFELLHTNQLADDDMCMATPAIAGNKLLIRTDTRIYCLQQGARLAAASPVPGPLVKPFPGDAR